MFCELIYITYIQRTRFSKDTRSANALPGRARFRCVALKLTILTNVGRCRGQLLIKRSRVRNPSRIVEVASDASLGEPSRGTLEYGKARRGVNKHQKTRSKM